MKKGVWLTNPPERTTRPLLFLYDLATETPHPVPCRRKPVLRACLDQNRDVAGRGFSHLRHDHAEKTRVVFQVPPKRSVRRLVGRKELADQVPVARMYLYRVSRPGFAPRFCRAPAISSISLGHFTEGSGRTGRAWMTARSLACLTLSCQPCCPRGRSGRMRPLPRGAPHRSACERAARFPGSSRPGG